jgi:hypothetical protein
MDETWYLIIKWNGCGHLDKAVGWYVIEPNFDECPFCGMKSELAIKAINDPSQLVPNTINWDEPDDWDGPDDL